jgi:hypothetical protein
VTTNDRHDLYTFLNESVALIDLVLPDIIEVLGPDHPGVVEAMEELEELKTILKRMGYTPILFH